MLYKTFSYIFYNAPDRIAGRVGDVKDRPASMSDLQKAHAWAAQKDERFVEVILEDPFVVFCMHGEADEIAAITQWNGGVYA